MPSRTSRSYRASDPEMSQIERAARVVDIDPGTLVRRASVAAARRILEAAEEADLAITRSKHARPLDQADVLGEDTQ